MFTEGYIGYTAQSVETRYSQHLQASRSSSKKPYIIHRAINKYGSELIVSTIVEGPEDYCLDVEFKLRPEAHVGWNQNIGGSKPPSALGRSTSDDTKVKMSIAATGRKLSESTIEKLRISNTGRKQSLETRELKSKAFKGLIKITDQGRKALSDHHKSLREWQRSRSNKTLWSQALEAFKFKLETEKFTRSSLAEFLNVKSTSANILHKRLVDGWKPLEDSEWLDFKEQYDKETHEQT